MSDERLDAKLRAFLDADARARANGITIEALYKVVVDIASDRLMDRKAAKADREAAADASGREFTARNTCTGAFGNIYTTGAGTTVTVANGKTAILGVDSGGVYRVTADV